MDRQLSVFAAPALVLLVTILAFFFGHAPGAGRPREPVARRAAAASKAPTTPAKPAPEKPVEEAEPKPAPQQKPPVAATPPKQTEPKVADADSKPAEASAGEAKSSESKSAAPSPSETAKSPGSTPAPAVSDPSAPRGTITGRILFDGTPPLPKDPIAVPAHQAPTCCAERMDLSDHTLRVSPDGGVADIVVMVKVASAEADGTGKISEIDQACCRFDPHVLLVEKGATVRYRNSDDTNHNVHINARKNPHPNPNVAGGSHIDVEVPKDEEFSVTCDIHPWMECYVVVTKYATSALSDANGNFRIENVPAGEHTVELWGESVKPAEKKLSVRVEAGGTASVEYRVAKK